MSLWFSEHSLCYAFSLIHIRVEGFVNVQEGRASASNKAFLKVLKAMSIPVDHYSLSSCPIVASYNGQAILVNPGIQSLQNPADHNNSHTSHTFRRWDQDAEDGLFLGI